MDISKENFDTANMLDTDAYFYMDASYEPYKEEVKRNRSIFYRARKFFKKLFHK